MERPDIERIRTRNVIEFSDVDALIEYIEALEAENAALRDQVKTLMVGLGDVVHKPPTNPNNAA